MRKHELQMDMASIGLLKAARAALHWSQGDLAERSGVSLSTIKNMERRAYTKGGSGAQFQATSFFTTYDVINAMLGALAESGVTILEKDQKAHVVIDPSAGTGAFMLAARRFIEGSEDQEQ